MSSMIMISRDFLKDHNVMINPLCLTQYFLESGKNGTDMVLDGFRT